jgi:hypothetical protein
MSSTTEKISELRSILQSGVRKVVVDGVVTEYDLDAIRRELDHLMQEDQQQRHRRPRASTIYLGGF